MSARQGQVASPRMDHEAFVKAFADHWQGGRQHLDSILSLLGPDIRLSAPGLRSTRGKDAARAAFEKTFEVLPDLTAEVHSWAAQGDTLFIEMTFSATIGSRLTRWRNVDRFLFREGVAVERVAYFDQTKVLRAFLSGPSGISQLFKRIRHRI